MDRFENCALRGAGHCTETSLPVQRRRGSLWRGTLRTLKQKSGRMVQFCPNEWHPDWDALCVVATDVEVEVRAEGPVLPGRVASGLRCSVRCGDVR
jgi:hypothetical protein